VLAILDRLRRQFQLGRKRPGPHRPSVQVFFGDRQIAELEKREDCYFFHYMGAFRDLKLSPIPGFPDVDRKEPYVSKQLFPFFQERIPDRTRPEIQELIKKLGVPQDDELRLLTELSRHSVTDPFELKLANAT
jgi:HipA N-terminal domain